MERKKEFLISFLYVCVIIAISYFAVKYLLGSLLPFIIAYLIVSVSSETIEKLTFGKLKKKTASIIFTLLIVTILAVIIYLILSGIISEAIRLYTRINNSEMLSDLGTKADEYFRSFDESSLTYKIYSTLSDYLSKDTELFEKLSSEYLPKAISFLMGFISFFPSAIIFIFVLFISLFYIGYDYDKITDFLCLQLSDRMLETISETKEILFSTVKELFKSYFLLTFITFIQLLIGFIILETDYAFILAATICFIDLLPILGTGTVLFPWSAICFLLGDYKRAVGLLVLYAVISIFRQVAEPKIVGANLGLSPLLSLISIFMGFRLFGFWGLIIFPIIMITVIRLNEKGLIKLYKNFPHTADMKIQKTKRKFLDFKRNDK